MTFQRVSAELDSRDGITRDHAHYDHKVAELRKYGREVGRLTGVYLVRCESFIKIGVARVVLQRVKLLQQATPFKLTPLGWLPEPNPEEAEELESYLHRTFRDIRERGEWFRDEPVLMDFIARHAWPFPVATNFNYYIFADKSGKVVHR